MKLSERIESVKAAEPSPSSATTSANSRVDRVAVKTVVGLVRDRLAETSDRNGLSEERLRHIVETEVVSILASPEFAGANGRLGGIRSAVLDEILGFGLLQELLDDPTISEIMVNGAQSVYAEADGVIRLTDLTFESEEQLMRVVDRLLRPSGRRVDQSSPMVDARLPDGSRLNVVLPPLSIDGPALTIRKFTSAGLAMDDLVRSGSVSAEAAEFLEKAVRHRMNLVVSGGTGTGKTTILNILSSFIDRSERVVTVEDAVELTLDLPNIVRLETRLPNSEGAGEVTIRDLVRNALRMRPNRIVVGEVRGSETIDMLQAMNTGHEGSLSTVHANSPRDALRRIETMILLGGAELPLRAVREQVATSIDVLVHLNRDDHGRRLVSSISEVEGMEGDVISLAELFHRPNAPAGHIAPLVPTALTPRRLFSRSPGRSM